MGRKKGGKNKDKIVRKAVVEEEPKFVEKDVEVEMVVEEVKKTYQKNEEIKRDLVRCPKCDGSDTVILGTMAFPMRTMMLEGNLITGMRVQRRTCKCRNHFILKLPLK